MFNSIGMDGEQSFVETEGNRLGRIVQKMAIASHFVETGFRPAMQSWYQIDFFHGGLVPASSRLTNEPVIESFAPDFRYKYWIDPRESQINLMIRTNVERSPTKNGCSSSAQK
ncbi:MAG: hypothetical protein JWP89_867 [Schlesneria sp.]|nr:hypothetical protein [Schlesneria sp.]